MKHLIGLAGRSLAVLALVVSLSGRSDGASITAISATGTGFTLDSSSFSNVAKTITLNMTANKIGLPFSNVRFDLARVIAPTSDTYTVTLNLTNAVGREIPGLDIDNGNQGGAGFSGSLVSLVNPGAFTFEDINPGTYNLANGYRLGGLSGGGSTLANGAPPTTITFTYLLTNGPGPTPSGFSSLNFTANPEPTTLLLGSLAMIPAAVVARRRRKAALELIEA